MTLAMTINGVLAATSALLAIVLVALYGRMLSHVRTRLTFGLFTFSALFLIQNVVQLYFFSTMMQYYAGNVENLILVQNALATGALAFLAYVTLSPGSLRRKTPATHA